MILADDSLSDGTRYRAVQSYKDFAESGWVVGIYIAESGDRWRLRYTGHGKSPWKRAIVTTSSGGLIVAVENESNEFTIPISSSAPEKNDERGFSFPIDASTRDMARDFIHTTY
jgi:hypothetical protein